MLALPETAGSALYGLVDVLTSTGSIWQSLTRTEVGDLPFHVQIASIAHAAVSLRQWHSGRAQCFDP